MIETWILTGIMVREMEERNCGSIVNPVKVVEVEIAVVVMEVAWWLRTRLWWLRTRLSLVEAMEVETVVEVSVDTVV